MIYSIQPIVERFKTDIKAKIIRNDPPTLDIVTTSDDYASKKYVGNKVKTGTELGLIVRTIGASELKTSTADGIIVQLPVGEGLNERELIESVEPSKDVDGFNDKTLGEIMRLGTSQLAPCTALGVCQIIEDFFETTDLSGLDIVIINRSNIVGKPLSMMLLGMNGTVSILHSKTKDIKQYTKNADCVVTAVGKANFITRDMLKEGCLVVDVGICRGVDNKISGDCDKTLYDDPSVFCTPVPKGVGQLTVLNLMNNTVRAKYKF